MPSRKNNSGFTLIELVIVIVLIGILAATALPKFANMTSNARTAAAQGVAGALGAAVAIGHSSWIANGGTVGTAGTTVSLEGTTITMSGEGWPEYTSTAGTAGTMTGAKCLEVWNGILNGPPVANVSGSCTAGSCEFLSGVNASDSTLCEFTDEAGSGSNTISYDVNTGAVSVS